MTDTTAEALAEALMGHELRAVYNDCSCGEYWHNRGIELRDWYRVHLAAALVPVVAAQVEAARAEAVAPVLALVDKAMSEFHRWANPTPTVTVDELIATVTPEAVAAHNRAERAAALREFADTRGINVGDEDGEWWDGYRQAQRECLRDAVDRADALDHTDPEEAS